MGGFEDIQILDLKSQKSSQLARLEHFSFCLNLTVQYFLPPKDSVVECRTKKSGKKLPVKARIQNQSQSHF